MKQCRIKHHDDQKIKYICVDKNCNAESRIGCADCFLEQHVPDCQINHQRILINDFQAELKRKAQKISNVSFDTMNNEFDDKFTQVINRLMEYSKQMKGELENERKQLQVHVDQFNTKVQDKIDLNNKISQLSPNEINQSISFYHSSDNIILELQQDYKGLEQQRTKLIQKQQKMSEKLNSVVQLMLQHLDPTNSPKKQILQSQISSTTQSPPMKSLNQERKTRKRKN